MNKKKYKANEQKKMPKLHRIRFRGGPLGAGKSRREARNVTQVTEDLDQLTVAEPSEAETPATPVAPNPQHTLVSETDTPAFTTPPAVVHTPQATAPTKRQQPQIKELQGFPLALNFSNNETYTEQQLKATIDAARKVNTGDDRLNQVGKLCWLFAITNLAHILVQRKNDEYDWVEQFEMLHTLFSGKKTNITLDKFSEEFFTAVALANDPGSLRFYKSGGIVFEKRENTVSAVSGEFRTNTREYKEHLANARDWFEREQTRLSTLGGSPYHLLKPFSNVVLLVDKLDSLLHIDTDTTTILNFLNEPIFPAGAAGLKAFHDKLKAFCNKHKIDAGCVSLTARNWIGHACAFGVNKNGDLEMHDSGKLWTTKEFQSFEKEGIDYESLELISLVCVPKKQMAHEPPAATPTEPKA